MLQNAWGYCSSRFSNTRLNAATAAAGPSGWFQTPLTTARKSAPAVTRGGQLSTVMPPMATQGTVVMADQISRISGSALVFGTLVVVGKKAPKAT